MNQPHLSWWTLTSKCSKHTFLLSLWPLKASGLPFILSFGLQKHQSNLLSSFQTWKYVNLTLIQAFLLLKTWYGHGFLYLKTEKHHSYLALTFLTTVDFIYYLFQGFSAVITYTVPSLFIYSVPKHHCYILVGTLASKNISGSLFVVCLSLNAFFVPFSGILCCKYIKHTYPVAVYTLNTQRTSYYLFLTAENAPLIFHAVVLASKTSTVSFFQLRNL